MRNKYFYILFNEKDHTNIIVGILEIQVISDVQMINNALLKPI